jgi:RNA recognition motif-containing protein
MNIYVGNLPYRISEDELRELFAQYGDVSSAKIIIDRDSGRSKGFGFVEMPDDSQAKTAIEALNGTDVQGRNVVINEARPRPERPPRR